MERQSYLIRLLQSRYYWLAPLLFWLVLVAISLAWNLQRLDDEVREIALERGRIMYQMVRQTKINPQLMKNDPEIFKRQVMEDIGYRAVSTKPMNPENRADDWEARALSKFTRQTDFHFELQGLQGKPQFRYIGPVFVQENCLSCHGYEGIKVGDLRGGISVTVNARPIYEAQATNRYWVMLTHLGSFLLLAGSSTFLLGQLRRHWELLTETRDRLKQQEDFLRSITQAMGEGCVVLDPQGVVTFANQESEWILGWEGGEIVGRRWNDLVSPAQAGVESETNNMLRQTLRDGMLRRGEDQSLVHKDGLLIPIAFSVSAISSGDQVSGAVLTFNDISERKHSEEERSRLERQLNQTHKMEAVGQLAGGIAHEINTPIQYVSENLRFMQEAYDDIDSLLDAFQALMREAESNSLLSPQVEKVKSVMEEIEFDYLKEETPKTIKQSLNGAEQVARIVLAMKEFAHPGSRQMAPADINKIVTNTVAVSRNEWKYVAETELALAPDLPAVDCLGGEIAQVVMNLIVNAAHAIEHADKKEKGKITLASSLHDGQVELRITDNGTGIAESVRDSVFNPFFTTKDVGKGTGQGLAIAQDIVVAKHRGELFFETEEGRGTTFIMRLPLTQATSPEASQLGEPEHPDRT
jgi:two-component system, NtrC family, sensor kinase